MYCYSVGSGYIPLYDSSTNSARDTYTVDINLLPNAFAEWPSSSSQDNAYGWGYDCAPNSNSALNRRMWYDNKVLYWASRYVYYSSKWVEQNASTYQLNNSNAVYYWFAIG